MKSIALTLHRRRVGGHWEQRDGHVLPYRSAYRNIFPHGQLSQLLSEAVWFSQGAQGRVQGTHGVVFVGEWGTGTGPWCHHP